MLNESIKEIKSMNSAFANINFEIRLGAGPYVAGEETALFESIEGNIIFICLFMSQNFLFI